MGLQLDLLGLAAARALAVTFIFGRHLDEPEAARKAHHSARQRLTASPLHPGGE